MAGLASGYGFCSGIGVPFNQLHLLLPFIVMGIGVDDLIIITFTFDQTNIDDPPELRVRHTLENCGVSIAFTTLTDIVAFLFGSSSSIPAIRGFCVYAAASLFFNFLFQVTAYTAMLCLDAKRMNAGRRDFFFCFKWSGGKKKDLAVQPISTTEQGIEEQVDEQNVTQTRSSHVQLEGEETKTSNDRDDQETKNGGSFSSGDMTKGQYFFSEIYFPYINNLKVRLVVLVGFAFFFGISLHWALQLDIGLDLVILVPDDSYVKSYINTAREVELFGFEFNVPVSLYLEEVSYHEKDTTQQIISLQNNFLEKPFNTGPMTSWVSAFNGWVATSPHNTSLDSDGFLADRETYYLALEDFLKVPHFAFFADHIVFNYKDSGEGSSLQVENIRISKLSAYHIDQDSSQNRVTALETARDVCEDAHLHPEAFPLSVSYKYTEIDIIIFQELLLNLSLAVLAVGFISLIVLINPKAVLLVTLLIISVDVEVLGMMVFWDLTLNTVTLVQLVMAVGLVVDYMAHIAHHYSLLSSAKYPSNDEKLRVTLREVAPGVSMGCFTTLLGVFPLSLATSAMFRMFFKMFLSIVAFGALHGFVILPAILPWITLNAYDDIVDTAANVTNLAESETCTGVKVTSDENVLVNKDMITKL